MRSKSIEVEGARMLPSKVNHAINLTMKRTVCFFT
jgi:hypothetical protein